ncbi:hypothetical protein NT6N_22940 [Oceaniferula spumae]|uniref:Entericidin n=1 Tax=Oceaniferula spumae TaxID=2979115 RepID=A0AAT9FMM2_9BACT
MKNSCYLIVLTIASLAFGSCNTFIGMGRDIQGVGRSMQNKGYSGDWNGAAQPDPSNPYGVPAAPAQ